LAAGTARMARATGSTTATRRFRPRRFRRWKSSKPPIRSSSPNGRCAPDSGGAGEYRGGLGAIYEIELLEKQADVFLFGERGKFPPGVAGGGEAATNRFFYEQDDGAHEPPMASKIVGIQARKRPEGPARNAGRRRLRRSARTARKAIARDVRLGLCQAEHRDERLRHAWPSGR
jgi:hypothetical protein